MKEAVFSTLFAGILGYAAAITVYMLIGMPYVLTILMGGGVAFCSGGIVYYAVIHMCDPPPPPKL